MLSSWEEGIFHSKHSEKRGHMSTEQNSYNVKDFCERERNPQEAQQDISRSLMGYSLKLKVLQVFKQFLESIISETLASLQ